MSQMAMGAFRDDILEDRVGLVTGRATDLGKEIARTLGQHGAGPCIASHKQDHIEAAGRPGCDEDTSTLLAPS